MNDLSEYTEEQLKTSIRQLEDDREWNHLAVECQKELFRRNPIPLEEIFPEGGYMDTDSNGKEFWIPFKE